MDEEKCAKSQADTLFSVLENLAVSKKRMQELLINSNETLGKIVRIEVEPISKQPVNESQAKNIVELFSKEINEIDSLISEVQSNVLRIKQIIG